MLYVITNRKVRSSFEELPWEEVSESAGLKHFGKRRLGRAGMADPEAAPDNVWQHDCTPYLTGIPTSEVHSGYFAAPEFYVFLRRVLRGEDRRFCTGKSHHHL